MSEKQKNRMTKSELEPKGPMGYHQAELHYGNPRRRREKEAERRNNGLNLPNLMKDMNLYIQETRRTPSGIISKRCTLRHMIV